MLYFRDAGKSRLRDEAYCMIRIQCRTDFDITRRYLDHLKDTWQTFYDCNPRNFNGTLDLMVGGHASMWGEHVDAR